MLNSNSVASIINKPTRVTDTSSTNLDHILTNEDRYFLALFVVKYHITIKSPNPSSVYLYLTSPQEIIRVINSLHLNKPCDYDDIFLFLLKTAAHVIAYPLSMILNRCISLGVFPNQLKIAKVISVYKSGPSIDLQNYRPISLLSSLSKIFEKVILRKLVSFLERNNLIIPSQFGL